MYFWYEQGNEIAQIVQFLVWFLVACSCIVGIFFSVFMLAGWVQGESTITVKILGGTDNSFRSCDPPSRSTQPSLPTTWDDFPVDIGDPDRELALMIRQEVVIQELDVTQSDVDSTIQSFEDLLKDF